MGCWGFGRGDCGLGGWLGGEGEAVCGWYWNVSREGETGFVGEGEVGEGEVAAEGGAS